jgi:hypothetical protein
MANNFPTHFVERDPDFILGDLRQRWYRQGWSRRRCDLGLYLWWEEFVKHIFELKTLLGNLESSIRVILNLNLADGTAELSPNDPIGKLASACARWALEIEQYLPMVILSGTTISQSV